MHKRGGSCISSTAGGTWKQLIDYLRAEHERVPNATRYKAPSQPAIQAILGDERRAAASQPDTWLDMRGSVRISSSWTLWSSQLSRADRHACCPHVHAHTHDVQTGFAPMTPGGQRQELWQIPSGWGGKPSQAGQSHLLELGT